MNYKLNYSLLFLLLVLFLCPFSNVNAQTGAITLDHVVGSPGIGEINADTEISFKLRVENSTGETIQGLINSFRVFSPDGANWTQLTGDTIGTIGKDMFNLVYGIQTFSNNGSGADSISFGGATYEVTGLPDGFNEIAYEVNIGPILSSDVGKTICLDSTWTPPAGKWIWSVTNGGDYFPSWDGPHCFTVVVAPDPLPLGGAISLDNVLGSPNAGEISAESPIGFQLRLQNDLSEMVNGITNGFVIYSPDGASWGSTAGDTIGTVNKDMFNLYFGINLFSPNGYGADSIFFGGVSFGETGLTVGFDEVSYQINIGPIGVSNIGKTICLDSTFTPPTGKWIWGAGVDTYAPAWDGPHCFTIVEYVPDLPGVNDDSLIVSSLGASHGINSQVVSVKLVQPIKGATIPLAIPEGVNVLGVSSTGFITETWDYNIIHIKPDSGFIFIALANSSGLEIPVGETDLFSISFTSNNPYCDQYITTHWDTTLIDDNSRRLTFADTNSYPITVGFDMSRDSVLIPELVPGDNNNDGTLDIADLILLVDYMFHGGSKPLNMNAVDINADCIGPDIADLIRLIDYMFQGGDVLTCGCLGSLSKQNITPNNDVVIKMSYEGSQSVISVNSSIDLMGIELVVRSKSDHTPERIYTENLDLLYHSDNNSVKLGIVDLKGEHAILSGETRLISFDGECEIISAVVADRESHSIVPVINNKITILPDEYKLMQNYPNPFNPTTQISFWLPEPGFVKLSIYNISGQKVTTLVGEHKEAGEYSVEWDASNQSSGIYLYRLESNQFSSTKKMLFIK